MKTNKTSRQKLILILFALAIAFSSATKAATYYSIATGNWGAATTWSLSSGGSPASSAPGNADEVVIEGGYTVTMDAAATCSTLTIGTLTTSGILINTLSYGITVTGSFTLNQNCSLDLSNGTLTVGGNYACSGTVIYGSSASTIFNKTSTQTLSGSSTIEFNNVTISGSGTNLNNSSSLTLKIKGDFLLNQNCSLTLSNGHLKVGGNYTCSGLIFFGSSAITSFDGTTKVQNLTGSSTINFNSIIIDNSFGVQCSVHVNNNLDLRLEKGEFTILAGKILTFQGNVNSTISKNTGTLKLDGAALYNSKPTGRTLYFNSTGIITDNKIGSIYINATNSAINFAADETIKIVGFSGYGYIAVGNLEINGTITSQGGQNCVNWLTPSNGVNNLWIGNGSNAVGSYTIDAKIGAVNNLIINANNATFNLGRSATGSGTFRVKSNIQILSGTLVANTFCTTFTIDVGVSIEKKSGTFTVNSGTYTYGTGISVSYTGSSNLTVGDEIKTGSTVGSLTVNLSDNTKTITTKSAASLTVSGNVVITSGILALANELLIGGNYTQASSNASLNTGSNLITFNGTAPQTLSRTGGGTITFNGLTINNTIGGIALGSGANATNLSLSGTLTLSSGTLNLGSNTLTYSGTSISRTSGNINTSNGTVVFTNSSVLSLPSSLFFNDAAYNLTLNGTGGVSLSGSLSISNVLNLSSGALNLNGQTLNMASGATLNRVNGSMSASPAISSGSYQVSYSGNTDITSTPELFPTGGGGVGNVSVNLSNPAKAITISNSTPFAPLGNFTITAGIVNLSNLTSMQSGNVLSTGSAGVLNTNGWLLLKGSASSAPASIGNSSGSINGKVMVEVAIPAGKRASRLMAHPFSENISLDSLIDDIHITGTGGSANGFDETILNKPSAFTFSEADYNGTKNSGWNAFTNINTPIASKEAFRIYYRGPRTQSNILDDNPPTPEAGKITYSGSLNQGNITLNLNYTAANGSNAGWNLVGNPYPASIDMQTMIAGNNLSATYYVWNTLGGNFGIYSAYTFGSDQVVLPMGGAFVVRATGSSPSLSFQESNKTVSAPGSGLLKKANSQIAIELWSDDTIWWDRLQIKQQSGTFDNLDNADAEKLENPDVNFYSIAEDGTKMAIDSRPNLKNTRSIWLGINSTAYHFTLKIKQLNTPGLKVFLMDHFLNKKQALLENTSYNFNINENSASSGNKRFELIFEDEISGIHNITPQELLTVYPNPVSGDRVYLAAPANAGQLFNFQIISLNGQLVQSGEINLNEGIQLEGLENGVYFLNIFNENVSAKVKLILLK